MGWVDLSISIGSGVCSVGHCSVEQIRCGNKGDIKGIE